MIYRKCLVLPDKLRKPSGDPRTLRVPLETIPNINETIPQIYSHHSRPINTQQIVTTLSLWPRRFDNHGHVGNPFVQWPIAEPWTSISVPMITRMIFEWTFGYHVMFPLLRDTSQNTRRIGILLSHHVLTIPLSLLPVLFFFLVIVFWHLPDEVTCVWPDDDGCHHTERALRISLHRRRSKSHSRAI